MPFCPLCETEYPDRATRCAACAVDLVPVLPTGSAGEWVTVYAGPTDVVRLIEMRLTAFQIPFHRLAAHEPAGVSELHTPRMAAYRLVVPEAMVEQKRDLILSAVRSATGAAGTQEDAAAMAEAEEDYDVRACPACLLYFHDNYAACPGCGAGLVPAVEIFEEGQAEPDRVIIADGPAEATTALADRLREAGFHPDAFEVEGWPVTAADLPWRELTDRTAEAERLCGCERKAPPLWEYAH